MKRRTLLAATPLLALPALAGCGADGKSEGSAGGSTSSDSGSSAAGGTFTVKDVVGRSVTLKDKPQRVILGESRQVFSLVFLNRENPVDKVVAWGNDLQRAAADFYKKLVAVAPQAEKIPTIGSISKGDLTVESLLAFKPDVLLMTLDHYKAAQTGGFLAKIDAAKIPYLVTDFRRDPINNTIPSVELLAKVFGYEKKASEFLDYYRGQVTPVMDKAKTINPKPSVFLWRAPGLTAPCGTFGKANLGLTVTAAGGTNIADALLSGDEGTLTPEQILKSQPQVVIATGGEWGAFKPNAKAATSYVHLGYDADESSAQQSLAALRKQPGFEHLKAFDTKSVHAVYHQFYDSPYNFVALLAFAKWENPKEFGDLDPHKQWADFHEKFMPWKLSGTFLVTV